jgi:ATP-dependent DNA helicase RecQ
VDLDECPDTCPDVLLDAARARFGLASLHAFQREAVSALLDEGARVLLVAPTGGGKSLCYQLPAVLLSGTALVISPLISLMEDQVRALAARGVAATFLSSTLPREENGRRLAALRKGAVRVLYVAPERLHHEGLLDALGAVPISLVAVDEAHCIVQWGHDFRPEYLRIGEALARLRPPRVLACTATATPEARAEIARRLGWEEGQATLVLRGFARPNLHLAARAVRGPREAGDRTAAALADALGDPLSPGGAGIVYVPTRRRAERLASVLRERGWDAAAYHAGLDPELRARVSAAFAERTLPVVVATNAFGMGIDRADVRVVIHAGLPGSIDAYYQEVGRAGRDGAAARGLLLFSGADVVLRRRLAGTGEGGAPAEPAAAERALTLLRELLRYVDAGTCRHDFILRHFADEAESLGGCGHCDVCRDAEAPPPPSPPPAPPAPTTRERPTTVEDALARGMDRALFDALSAHRAALARRKAVPVYVVAPNRTLTEIALLRPRCLEDLGMVHGMGPGRIAAYGEGLLSVVRGASS